MLDSALDSFSSTYDIIQYFRNENFKVICFQIGHLIGNQTIRNCMRFIEPIVIKF